MVEMIIGKNIVFPILYLTVLKLIFHCWDDLYFFKTKLRKASELPELPGVWELRFRV